MLTTGQEINIRDVRHCGGCVLELEFSDGHVQRVDFTSFLESAHPELHKYLAEENFCRYVLKNGMLNWNDYDMCFSLETLYTGKFKEPEELLCVAEPPAEPYKTR